MHGAPRSHEALLCAQIAFLRSSDRAAPAFLLGLCDTLIVRYVCFFYLCCVSPGAVKGPGDDFFCSSLVCSDSFHILA